MADCVDTEMIVRDLSHKNALSNVYFACFGQCLVGRRGKGMGTFGFKR